MQLFVVVLVYNIVMLGVLAPAIVWFQRRTTWTSFVVCGATVLVFGLALALVASPGNPLRVARLLCYGWFGGFAVFLAAVVVICRHNRRGISAVAASGLAVTVGITVYAFCIEPFRLELTRVQLTCEKLDRPLRIALLADFQTDVP